MSRRNALAVGTFALMVAFGAASARATDVIMQTTMGDIRIQLYDAQSPITVENFLVYVNEGFYDGDDGIGATIFHRVVPGFVIQGGGHLAVRQCRGGRLPADTGSYQLSC